MLLGLKVTHTWELGYYKEKDCNGAMNPGGERGSAEVTSDEENCDKETAREGSCNALEEEEEKEGEGEEEEAPPWERGYVEQTNYQTCSIYRGVVEV